MGGVNYFDPSYIEEGGSFRYYSNAATSSGSMTYCNARAICLDRNSSATSTFTGQVHRVVTLLHDAFDGHGANQNQPSNAAVWDTDTTPFSYATSRGGDARDEGVALGGREIYGMLANWWFRSSSFTLDTVFAGLGDSMTGAGYSWCDQCRLFVLQSASPPDTDAARYARCASAPISNWLGTMPDPNDPASCTYAAYPFVGCQGSPTSVCDELVDPFYFVRHPACSKNALCGGSYSNCSLTCPRPSADEIPNVVVKADGTPTPNGSIRVVYIWTAGGTGGFFSSLVEGSSWTEFQIGAGVHVPNDGRPVTIICNTDGSANRVITEISVRWNNGTSATFPCGTSLCQQNLAPNGGLVATCRFAEP